MDRSVLTKIIGIVAIAAGCGRAPLAPQPAPDFAVESVDIPVETTRLSSLRGKVVVIDFWATWCGPCKATMPQLERLHREFGPKGMALIAISSESRATLRAHRSSSNINYPWYCDINMQASQAFKVEAIPRTIVVDREGLIVFDQVGLDDGVALRKAVESALAARSK